MVDMGAGQFDIQSPLVSSSYTCTRIHMGQGANRGNVALSVISNLRMEVHVDTGLNDVLRMPGLSMCAPKSFASLVLIFVFTRHLLSRSSSQQC